MSLALPAHHASVAAQPPPEQAVSSFQQTMRKCFVRIIPFLILMYMMAFLDRANVGMAKQALAQNIGLSPAAYALGAGIFFVSYACFEVPSNLIMHRVGARVWMARIMITWGLVAAATMFVKGATSFVVIRLMLGVAEAGFFPGVILYLTYWFPPEQRGRALGLFSFGYPVAMLFGTPLSGMLLRMDGAFGLQGWQWMFAIEGLMAALVGVIALFVLHDRPADVTWLTREQKTELSRILQTEEDAKRKEGSRTLLDALKDRHILLYIGIYFFAQIGSYGIAFYLPDQVSALMGQKIGLMVSFVSAIPWFCAIVATVVLPRISARLNMPRRFLLTCFILLTVSIATSAHVAPLPAIVMLCVATGAIVSAQAIFWTFPTDRFGGAAAAGGIALINSLGNLGGFLAPNLRAYAEKLFGTPSAGPDAVAAVVALSILLTLLLPARGRRVETPGTQQI